MTLDTSVALAGQFWSLHKEPGFRRRDHDAQLTLKSQHLGSRYAVHLPQRYQRAIEQAAVRAEISPDEIVLKALSEFLSPLAPKRGVDQRCDLLTPKQAALLLNRSVSTLAKMRCSGDGPTFVKLGRRTVGYRRSDLAEYVDECRRQSTSEC